jgi:hypothetical protein
VIATFKPSKLDEGRKQLDFRRHERPSAASKNKYGEMGSPCRIPRVGLNDSNGVPLNKTENDTVDIIFISNLTHEA